MIRKKHVNSKKNVWIIDDDPGILEVVQIIVEEEGYNTKIISNEALFNEELEHTLPDLIFLDILMAGNDGSHIARKLKISDRTKHIPIIMMSADIHVGQKAKEVQADDYIRKPFDIKDLVTILKKHVEH